MFKTNINEITDVIQKQNQIVYCFDWILLLKQFDCASIQYLNKIIEDKIFKHNVENNKRKDY